MMPALATLRLARPHPRPAPASPGLDDDALMTAARDGNRDAIEGLVRRHRDQVFGYAVKFFRDRALAADITQDVCLDLMRAIHSYSPTGSFRGFLYRVTLNRCRMHARRQRCDEAARSTLALVEAQAPRDADLATVVQDSLSRLGATQREVVLLRFWGGLTHEEIAKLLQIPVGTAKSRLLSALEALRQAAASHRTTHGPPAARATTAPSAARPPRALSACRAGTWSNAPLRRAARP